jgi:hypothetical protein
MKRQASLEASLEAIVKTNISKYSNSNEQIWKAKNILENEANGKGSSSARIKDGRTKDYLEEKKSLKVIHDFSKEDNNNISTWNEDILNQGVNKMKIKSLVDDNLSKKQKFIKPPVANHRWQMVMRKPKRQIPVGISKGRNYFKCFLPGHFKSQYKNDIKCFSCKKSCHVYYKCKEKKGSDSSKTVQYLQTEGEIQQKNDATDHSMAENFYDERPDMTTVYFEPRDHLNQHMQYLHQAGLVVLRQGGHHQNLKRAIAATELVGELIIMKFIPVA